MSAKIETAFTTDCNKKSMNHFLETVRTAAKQFKAFNNEFSDFISKQKRFSSDLFGWVTRYNILDAGPPCVYPIIQKCELLREMLVKIQEMTTLIQQALTSIKERFESLGKLHNALEEQATSLNWNPKENPAIKGSIHHRPPAQYLEDIADIIFHYDFSITCMLQYFDALNLQKPKSYENLSNSFGISTEIVNCINEFLIKSFTLLN